MNKNFDSKIFFSAINNQNNSLSDVKKEKKIYLAPQQQRTGDGYHCKMSD